MVIIYHVWPGILPGGFVGVDVFFVISGFLIVGSLVQELARTGHIRLAIFYAKRIRRLLPAATTVLLATMLAAVVLLPQNRWQSISLDVIMSALQVQNWNQAFSVDSYAAATALVSPVQHFWSLAVEEQFYLIIPVILLAGVAVAVKRRLRIETVSLWILAVVSLASFVHSVAFSSSQHDMAYFATTTRIWELGAGGIGALLIPKLRLRPVQAWLSGWVGLGVIVFSAMSLSVAMDFPGSIALLPVAGTLLLLTAGSPAASPATRGGPVGYSASRILGLRPVTYVGDLSYSLYLWHWPVVVFYVFHLGRAPGIIQGTALVAVSLALAVASYHLVEQKFRHGPSVAQRPSPLPGRWASLRRNAFVLAAGLIVASTVAAAVPWGVVEAKSQQLNAALNLRDYPGATAFDPVRPAAVPDGVPVRPDPAVAMKDVPLTWTETCGKFNPAVTGADQCVFGAPDATQTLVVVGDSHAAQYVDPLVIAGAAGGWKVQAMVRNGCPFTAAPAANGTTVYRSCSEQNKATLRRILQLRPGLVVVSGMAPAGYREALNWTWGSPEELVNGYVQLLKPLREAGIRVAVVPDMPYPDFAAPDCVQVNGPDSPKCQFTTSGAATDPLQLAGARVPGIEVLDMSAYFCRQGSCPAVIGNVLVYRDNHMTNTFAKTLAPVLARQLGF